VQDTDLDLLAATGEVLPSRKIFRNGLIYRLVNRRKKYQTSWFYHILEFKIEHLSYHHFWMLSRTGHTRYSKRQSYNYLRNYLSKQKRIFR